MNVLIEDQFSDFVSPGQACINPVHINKSNSSKKRNIVLEDDSVFEMIDGKEEELEKVSITLQDCLACSGCITTAETVLISLQTKNQVLEILKKNEECINSGLMDDFKTVVVSISPQSRASIGAKYDLDQLTVHKKLIWFFKKMGVHYIFDTSFSRDFSLLETAKEFVEKFKQYEKKILLTSSCPGWICYAEKTHPNLIPLISTTKSPQQVMGTLIKDFFAEKIQVKGEKIFHFTIMPCYDKKLEASRDDFFNDVLKTRDVDCVLTTNEVQQLFEEYKVDFKICEMEEISSMFTKAGLNSSLNTILYNSKGSTSGGYLLFVMRYAAKVIFNIELTEEEIEFGSEKISIEPGRNNDQKSVSLLGKNGEVLLKFGYAYGFRNIQNLVRKIGEKKRSFRRKTEVNDFNFVEIMACPSGCINGGGQLKPFFITGGVENSSSTPASKEWICLTEKYYFNKNIYFQSPETNSSIHELYKHWLHDDKNRIKEKLHTSYHVIEKLEENGLTVRW